MIRLLAKHIKPYLFLVFLSLLVLFGQAMAELYLPKLMSDIIDEGMRYGNLEMIYSIGGKMLLVTLLSTTCAIVASFFSAKIALGLGRDIRRSVFKRVENYSLNEFDNIGTASLVTRTTNDIVQVQQVVVMGFRFIIFSPIMCIGGMIMALSVDVHLSIIFAVALPILIAIMIIIGVLVVPSFTTMQKRVDKLNLTMRESLTGIRVIRAFDKTDYEKERFTQANKDLMDVSVRVNKIMALMMPLMMLIMNLTSLSIIWFGGLRVSTGQLEIGSMIAFTQYAMQIIMSVVMIAVMFVMIPRAQASSKRINEVLEMPQNISDPPAPKTATHVRGQVEFKNVSFQYEGSEDPVLKDISFVSKLGETTAIIGGTGSGKSTIINLIPRFYDATAGQVLINDTNVKDMSQKDVRACIGFVPQGAILFSGTINENVRFGKKDATDAEIEHACKIAQAHDFISNMPDTFETQISQGGTNVSGGQKQRISIARAIVRKPQIYIFDDSFSALDFKTDAKLRTALKSETTDATVLIVAQRVASIMDADQIVVLNEGEIAGIGKHRELLANCEVYKEICSSQLSEEELA